MKSLYEISGAFMEIAADENLTGEEVTEKLQGLEMELDAKVENGIGLIQSLKVTAEGMGAEIKRLNQRGGYVRAILGGRSQIGVNQIRNDLMQRNFFRNVVVFNPAALYQLVDARRIFKVEQLDKI